MLSSRSEGGGDSDGSGTPEPPIGRPQAPVGAAGGSGGENYGVDGIRVFEVEFPPTGPLGITFEWAADPEARSHGDGGTPVTSPRTHPLGSSTLPPISPSPSSARAGHADHPLRPPVGPALLPHALRIQSFPDLPPIETSTPSATAGAGTTTTAGEESEASIDGETKSTAVTSDDISGVLRQHPHTSHEPRTTCSQTERDTKNADVPCTGGSSAGAERPSSSESNTTGEAKRPSAAATEPLDGAERFGPVAGRDILRVGDVLVAVNGNPVAGPAARDAGVTCFEDVVGVVAAATTTNAQAQTVEGSQRTQPRVLKFKREARQQRPTSPTNASPPRNVPSKGGWVKGMSGSEYASRSSSSGATAERGTTNVVAPSDVGVNADADAAATPAAALPPPKSSWSTLYPVLKLKGWGRAHGLAAGGRTARDKAGIGFSAPLSSILRGSDASSLGMDSVGGQFSSRPRGSDASFISNTSSKASGTLRSRKRGKERKGKAGGSSVFSATSAAARIKAEAK